MAPKIALSAGAAIEIDGAPAVIVTSTVAFALRPAVSRPMTVTVCWPAFNGTLFAMNVPNVSLSDVVCTVAPAIVSVDGSRLLQPPLMSTHC